MDTNDISNRVNPATNIKLGFLLSIYLLKRILYLEEENIWNKIYI